MRGGCLIGRSSWRSLLHPTERRPLRTVKMAPGSDLSRTAMELHEFHFQYTIEPLIIVTVFWHACNDCFEQ